MQTIKLNEKALIKKQCYDVINLETKNSKRFLKKSMDNILIIFGNPKNYNVECFKRSDIASIIRSRTSVKNCKKRDENAYDYLFPITTSTGNKYLLEEDLRKILNTTHQIYYLEILEKSGYICQGEPTDFYTIKVCGGKGCLDKIFGPLPHYERKEEIDPEIYQEIDIQDWSPELVDAIENQDENRLDEILERIRNSSGNPGSTIDNSFSPDIEPVLIFAIKEGALNLVNMMLDNGASIYVEEAGINPLVASIFFTNGQDFMYIIQSLFNLDEELKNIRNEEFVAINVREYFDKEIRLRRDGRFRDVFDFIERYPEIPERENKLRALRYIYEQN